MEWAQFLLFFKGNDALVFVVGYFVLLIGRGKSGHTVEFSMQTQRGNGLRRLSDEFAACFIHQDGRQSRPVRGGDCRKDIGMFEGKSGTHVVAHGDAGQIDAAPVDRERVAHLFDDHIEKAHIIGRLGKFSQFPDIPPAGLYGFRKYGNETGAFCCRTPGVAVGLVGAAEPCSPTTMGLGTPSQRLGT